MCLPAFLLAFSSSSIALTALLLLVPTALSVAWLGPVVAAINGLVPAHMRSTASAIYLFILNLIGLGLGTLVIGSISDALTGRFGDEALRYSAMATTSLYAAGRPADGPRGPETGPRHIANYLNRLAI